MSCHILSFGDTNSDSICILDILTSNLKILIIICFDFTVQQLKNA